MRHQRESDEDLSDGARAELVAGRRGQSPGLKVIIPTSILAALVAALGFNATSSKTTGETTRSAVDQRVSAVEMQVAVIEARYYALQASLARIEKKLDEAEERERQRERRR